MLITAIRVRGPGSAADCTPTSSDLFALGYTYNGATNSNVAGITLRRGAAVWSQGYQYDSRNRIQQASESGSGSWTQNFAYDTVGNQAILNPGTTLFPTSNSLFYPNVQNANEMAAKFPRNQWTGVTYDAAGNQTGVNSGVHSFTFDGENRIRTATLPNMPAISYTYDGMGRRVRRTIGSAEDVFVYDAQGRLAAEHLATAVGGGGTRYVVADALGSTRLTMGGSGSEEKCFDYTPFGTEIAGGFGRSASCFESVNYPQGPTAVSTKFTGKERNAETGLDYFGARHLSAAQGRFTSADEPFADQNFSYPQSWNLYSYGRNNPLRFSDLDGRKCVQTSNGPADDGTGGGCEAAGVDAKGKITPQRVNVQDFEPPSLLLLAVARGAQRAEGPVTAAGIATGVVLTGGAAGIGAGAIGGTGLVSLSIGAARVAALTPLLPAAGDKMSQIIARLGVGFQNPQLAMQKLTEPRDAAVAAGTYAQGYYIQSGVTIYRVGQNYLTVSAQGKVISYVQDATAAGGNVIQRYA